MAIRHCIALLAMASAALVTSASDATAAGADTSFTCVSSDADTCVVTIPLTSGMNETVTSTMPDTQPWSLTQLEGSGTTPPPAYSIMGTDDFGTQWNGPPGATQGDVWTAILTTDDVAGGNAVLTFEHVQATTTAKPYTSLSWTTPNTAFPGQPVTVTAVVKPQPRKGHVILQRKLGSSWKTFAIMKFSAKQHHWAATFTWPSKPPKSEAFRLDATAAPGLLTTIGKPFSIRTAG
jgi:hypothetical protein